MANFGDFKGSLDFIISLLKSINRHTECASCGGTANIASAGVSTSVPAGFKSIAIVKTSTNSDSNTITLSDGSTYPMTELGEVFVDAASPGSTLPAYTISGAGSWKWHGIQ